MYKKPDRFPLTGPLKITDYKSYVEESKEEFFNLWNLKLVKDGKGEDFTVKKKLGSGEELFCHLRKIGKFEEHQAKCFGAQVVLIIEYLHKLDIVYRDLKPENLLIDRTGYLKVADFGFSKILKGRTYTLYGAPEYLAPEIVLNKLYGKSVDWWAVGFFLYELVAGKSPFYHINLYTMYEKAASGKFAIPSYLSTELQDFVKNILQLCWH